MGDKQNKTSEAQLNATRKYLAESVEEIKIRVPKGMKEKIKDYVVANGYDSINQFIIGLINDSMSDCR